MNAVTYRVVNAVALKNGMFALVGVVNGEIPDVGSIGVSSSH